MTRNVYIDRWRGLAILVMFWDHLLIMLDETSVQRYFTRISAPLFFLISGHLVRRINWQRLGIVFVIGYILGTQLSWIDGPNVLCIYAVGVPIIVYSRRWTYGIPLLIVVPLTIFANGFWHVTGYYNPTALIGLMALGQLFPVVPKLSIKLETIGKYPLSLYVGHLLLIAVIFRNFNDSNH